MRICQIRIPGPSELKMQNEAKPNGFKSEDEREEREEEEKEEEEKEE